VEEAMPIVALYAALLALLFVLLSLRTIRARRRLQVAVGDGGHRDLQRAMRVHANFAEYAPLALLLTYFVEVGSGPSALVHALGLGLLAGRSVHAYGVSQPKEDLRFRVSGMALTFLVLIVASLYLLYRHAGGLLA
jgi:uncharacterized membrane protein YecN with MAPEG domain